MIPELASSAKVKGFLKQLVKVKEAQQERDTARKNIEHHIKRLKKAPVPVKSKKVFEEDLNKLYSAIQETLEKERAILQLQREDSSMITALKSKIKELESRLASESKYQEKLDYITDLISRLHLELTRQADEKKRRQNRVIELENKIKNKIDSGNKEFLLVEDKVKGLEEKYRQLLSKGKDAEVDRLKQRLDMLKQKLEKMKL